MLRKLKTFLLGEIKSTECNYEAVNYNQLSIEFLNWYHKIKTNQL
jgi:hypothetical protein